jgi:hypothetical protein
VSTAGSVVGVPAKVSLTARALRLSALIWLIATFIALAFDVAIDRLYERMREQGATFEQVTSTLDTLQWWHTGLGVAAVAAVLVLSWGWIRRAGDRAALARTGWFLIIGSLALVAVNLVSRHAVSSEEGFDAIRWLHVGRVLLFHAGFTLLLAGTPGPAWRAAVYGVVASIRVSLVGWANVADEPLDLPWGLFIGLGIVADVLWALGLWSGAAHVGDDENDVDSRDPDDDRTSGAVGLRIVRGAFVSRVVIAAMGGVVLFASRDGAGGGVWLVTFAGICAAVAFGVGLTRYSHLPTRALSRGAVSVALIALALGGVLDVYGADATVTLLQWNAKAQGSSFFDMPSVSEAEAMQARARWAGGLASFTGLLGAMALTMSMRATARWVGDEGSVRRADALGVLTLLGGAIGLGGLTVLQAGAVRSIPLVLVVAVGALALGVWILVSWLVLFGALVRALEKPAINPP